MNIPFYPNTQDNLHCFEAALHMVLKYFQPDQDYTWNQLEQITGKQADLWTWPQQAFIWLHHQGYEIINIETFDYNQFIKLGEKYLEESYGTQAAHEQITHSNIVQEQATCKEFIQIIKTVNRLPDFEDISSLHDKGFIPLCLINSQALDNQSGYTGHFVVITNIDTHEITFHDPGLPPQESRHVSISEFHRSWASPDNNAKNLVGIRLVI